MLAHCGVAVRAQARSARYGGAPIMDPKVISANMTPALINQLRQQIMAVKYLSDGDVLPPSLLKRAVSVGGGITEEELKPQGFLGPSRGRGRALPVRGRGRGGRGGRGYVFISIIFPFIAMCLQGTSIPKCFVWLPCVALHGVIVLFVGLHCQPWSWTSTWL